MESAFGFRLIPTTTSSLLPHHLPLNNLKLPSLQRSSLMDQQRGNKRNMVRSSCFNGSDEIGPVDGFQFAPTKIFMEEAIGAEYGEGFETFRPDGPLKVDVHVLDKVLMWDNDACELERLKSKLSQLYSNNLLKLSEPMEGLKEWLDAVSTARIPCAVVSSLDRKIMVEILEKLGLMKYFQAIVTEEDGMDSMAHRLLSAAVKLDRKPSKCVVFEDDPRGVTAAHNCTMMAVALIGAHPAYDLVQADLAVGGFNELSVINLRRLFAHTGSSFMELQKQVVEKTPPKRRLTIDTIF
ncbi:haloacid dehalogenase-like hydrolase (HAD) superfamily protein [Artemisia annua]|uniref:Haloacid dehalogenase-like hydrolase (HAD) superfamily protein n=1 Tax=Artemisia annua TaxID=35608 RepID=A0A2U1MNQ3_ARTAN|nr:haloacid dehalogenase-like hydrolase (HAD) superfamily protein [Artemisia annua]